MRFLLFPVALLAPALLHAQSPPTAGGFNQPLDSPGVNPRYNLHFQTTYVYQAKPGFRSPYEGQNSLTGAQETQNSLTATLYLGARLWKGAAAYLNPELAGGSGLSGALGMGGSSNGETFRVGNPTPTLYLARLYLQQTFALGTGGTRDDDAANTLPEVEPPRYLRFLAGKYSLGDQFDNNDYANSPRTQFLNWSLMNNGAWDYAANVRGYTYAFTTVFRWDATTVTAALAALPTTANGPDLSTDLSRYRSIVVQVARDFNVAGRPATLRLLGYHQTGPFGSYQQAVAIARNPIYITAADLRTTDNGSLRTKTGVGLNYQQELRDGLGLFARAGWNDGRNETWAFTEIDQTLSAGLLLTGSRWHRPDDQAGVAVVANGLSQDHRDYLQSGGLGFIVGDGRLSYAPEGIVETFYTVRPALRRPFWFTADYQFCVNPGYNSDRGPVHIFSARAHVEF